MLKIFNVVSLSDKNILPEEILKALSKAFTSTVENPDVFFTVTESRQEKNRDTDIAK